MNITLGDMLPKEQARVRKILITYNEIGPAGKYGAMMIETDLKYADKAIISGDVQMMITACELLKGYTE